MHRQARRWAAAFGVLVCMTSGAQTVGAAPEPLALEAFFAPDKLRSVRSMRLSPSGRYLAAITTLEGRRTGLLLSDLEGAEAERFIEASGNEDLSWFSWVNDDWLIFSLSNNDGRRSSSGLVALRRDGTRSQVLIGNWSRQQSDHYDARNALPFNHGYIGPGAPGSDEIIVGEYKFNVIGEFSHVNLKALNVVTQAVRLVAEDAPRASGFAFDARGNPRVLIQARGPDAVVYWAEKPEGPWREISRAPRYEQPFDVEYVGGDDQLFVSTRDAEGYAELRPFDFAAGKPGDPVLLSTPGYDGVIAPLRRRGSGEVRGWTLSLDTRTVVWLEPEAQRLQDVVDSKLPGRVNAISCVACDKLVLIQSYSDVQPSEFILYRPGQNRWTLVGEFRPGIDATRMARLALHRIRSRDDQDLPVWVTRRPAADGKPQPAVVMVHGGPHLRGTQWAWDREAQFLASRGYVVIEPEFRGSEGYGMKHLKSGFKQWGLTMQDDISDALAFAVGKGWVDASRVCIMGASYGGYAALMGLVKDPAQYRCGVATSALSDPRHRFSMHWSDLSIDTREVYVPVTLGDPSDDEARFIATSPLEQVARIQAPVLLVHGQLDARVPVESGERMRDALRKNGKSVEWVVYDNEGHSIARVPNLLDYWRRVEAFLAQHLRPSVVLSGSSQP